MNPLVIQLVLTAALGAAMLRTLAALRGNQIGWGRSLLWTGFWSMGLIVVWAPGLTTRLAHFVGVGRGVDAVLYFSVALLSYLVFRLYVGLEKQDQVITRLVSALALERVASNRENS
jgi:hypothetical protein